MYNAFNYSHTCEDLRRPSVWGLKYVKYLCILTKTVVTAPPRPLTRTAPRWLQAAFYPPDGLSQQLPDLCSRGQLSDFCSRTQLPGFCSRAQLPDFFRNSALERTFRVWGCERNLRSFALERNFRNFALERNFPTFVLERNFKIFAFEGKFRSFALERNFPNFDLGRTFRVLPSIATSRLRTNRFAAPPHAANTSGSSWAPS